MGSDSTSRELLYKKGPSYLGQYAAEYVSKNYSRYFWVFHNVVFDIAFYNVTFDIDKVLKWINRRVRCTFGCKKFTLEKLEKRLPPTDGISICCPPPQPGKPDEVTIKCGEKVWIRLEPRRHIIYDYIFKEGNGLMPFKKRKDEKAEYLVFKGCKVSKNKLDFTAVTQDTLLTNLKVFTIRVTG
jgi:hypothetical protein